MYSSTLGPMVLPHLVKPGSTFSSVPPRMWLSIRKPGSPKLRAGIDWNTTLPLNSGSAKSIQEAGAGHFFSSNIFLS